MDQNISLLVQSLCKDAKCGHSSEAVSYSMKYASASLCPGRVSGVALNRYSEELSRLRGDGSSSGIGVEIQSCLSRIARCTSDATAAGIAKLVCCLAESRGGANSLTRGGVQSLVTSSTFQSNKAQIAASCSGIGSGSGSGSLSSTVDSRVAHVKSLARVLGLGGGLSLEEILGSKTSSGVLVPGYFRNTVSEIMRFAADCRAVLDACESVRVSASGDLCSLQLGAMAAEIKRKTVNLMSIASLIEANPTRWTPLRIAAAVRRVSLSVSHWRKICDLVFSAKKQSAVKDNSAHSTGNSASSIGNSASSTGSSAPSTGSSVAGIDALFKEFERTGCECCAQILLAGKKKLIEVTKSLIDASVTSSLSSTFSESLSEKDPFGEIFVSLDSQGLRGSSESSASWGELFSVVPERKALYVSDETSCVVRDIMRLNAIRGAVSASKSGNSFSTTRFLAEHWFTDIVRGINSFVLFGDQLFARKFIEYANSGYSGRESLDMCLAVIPSSSWSQSSKAGVLNRLDFDNLVFSSSSAAAAAAAATTTTASDPLGSATSVSVGSKLACVGGISLSLRGSPLCLFFTKETIRDLGKVGYVRRLLVEAKVISIDTCALVASCLKSTAFRASKLYNRKTTTAADFQSGQSYMPVLKTCAFWAHKVFASSSSAKGVVFEGTTYELSKVLDTGLTSVKEGTVSDGTRDQPKSSKKPEPETSLAGSRQSLVSDLKHDSPICWFAPEVIEESFQARFLDDLSQSLASSVASMQLISGAADISRIQDVVAVANKFSSAVRNVLTEIENCNSINEPLGNGHAQSMSRLVSEAGHKAIRSLKAFLESS